ncbi:MAG: sterol desaturase family protein [Cytophagales bacterium]|nr:sterol desaturase family protein [Cytophagales bacterium]
MQYVALALPVFMLAIALEYYLSEKWKKNFYSFTDTITNMSIGILDRLTSLIFAALFYFIYDFLHTHLAIFDLKMDFWNYVILFFLVDILWYWYHRCSHEINIFWAAHIVHHQSEEFNLTVGTRITIMQSFIRLMFWCALPIIGFPAPMIMGTLLVQGVYPFFIHTRLIGKLGFLENILVTPSHHRVHHGNNEIYLDKNYGGILIIWDKIFGTFEEEKEEIVFGLTKQLESKSFLWQFFHFFIELGYSIRNTPGILNKWKVLTGRPDQIDPTIRTKMESTFLVKTKDTKELNKSFSNYIIVQISGIIGVLIGVLYYYESMDFESTFLWSMLIIITLMNCGAIMEQNSWVFYLEYGRILVVMALHIYYFNYLWVWAIGLATVLATLYWFKEMKTHYDRKLAEV